MAGLNDHGYRQTLAPHLESRVQRSDKTGGSNLVDTYPIHRATMVNPVQGKARNTLYLHEVYWGDLSRVKGGLFGMLLGLFDLMFGLRHIAKAAAIDAKQSLLLRVLPHGSCVLIGSLPLPYRPLATCNDGAIRSRLL